jgi:hypothetical protein
MTVYTEGRHAAEFLLSEGQGNFSRDSIVIAASQAIVPGSVLGKRAVVADVVATASAADGNVASSGIIAMGSPAVTSKVKDGRYKGIAVTATTVRWEDPDGKEIGVSTHGSVFSKGGVKFTITAGGSANAAGDEFYIDVAADSADFEFGAHDPSATDGFEIAAAVALYGATTGADERTSISAVTRLAEVNGKLLSWDADITAAQKADAVQALADRSIIVR